MNRKLTTHGVGQYGKRAVETELRAHNWTVLKGNPLRARRDGRIVKIHVSTSGLSKLGLPYGSFQLHHVDDRSEDAFHVLVSMGTNASEDEFFIVPNKEVGDAVDRYREHWLKTHPHGRDDNWWVLKLRDKQSDLDALNWGFRRKWSRYRDNWAFLTEGANI